MEGYLFKRTSNAFKTWNRRWFYLYDNKLVYRKRSGEETETVMEDDLRLCTVKPVLEGERRFCFEVLSPSKYVFVFISFIYMYIFVYLLNYLLRSHMLQADSKEMYDTWIDALQKGIGAAIQRIHSCEISYDRNNEKSSVARDNNEHEDYDRNSRKITNNNNSRIKKVR